MGGAKDYTGSLLSFVRTPESVAVLCLLHAGIQGMEGWPIVMNDRHCGCSTTWQPPMMAAPKGYLPGRVFLHINPLKQKLWLNTSQQFNCPNSSKYSLILHVLWFSLQELNQILCRRFSHIFFPWLSWKMEWKQFLIFSLEKSWNFINLQELHKSKKKGICIVPEKGVKIKTFSSYT